MTAADIEIILNGEPYALAADHATVVTLLQRLDLRDQRVAVEVNGDVVPKDRHADHPVHAGDKVEVVTFVGGGDPLADEPLQIGAHTFRSRLFVGTGKYASNEETVAALEASGTECVTVALRRVDLKREHGPNLLDALGDRWTLLPNTAGCFTADDAVRTLRLARELGIADLVKLEVLADPETLLPDTEGTLVALKQLVKEDFSVLVYTNDDLVVARKLEDAGAAAVMPLGSAIGSGLGILNPINIQRIASTIRAPVIVDAGVGTASDVAVAMELGCDGVLLNTGIAKAQEPIRMAAAMRDACRAGRQSYLAGRMPASAPTPSSPTVGLVTPGAPR